MSSQEIPLAESQVYTTVVSRHTWSQPLHEIGGIETWLVYPASKSSRRRTEYYFVSIYIDCLTLAPGYQWLKRTKWLSMCCAVRTYPINSSRFSTIERCRNSLGLTRNVSSLVSHGAFSQCCLIFFPLDGLRRKTRCSRLGTKSRSGPRVPVKRLRSSHAREIQVRLSDLGWNRLRKRAWLWMLCGMKMMKLRTRITITRQSQEAFMTVVRSVVVSVSGAHLEMMSVRRDTNAAWRSWMINRDRTHNQLTIQAQCLPKFYFS